MEEDDARSDCSTAIFAVDACSSFRQRSRKHFEQRLRVAGLPKKPQLFAQRRCPSDCAWHLCSSAIFSSYFLPFSSQNKTRRKLNKSTQIGAGKKNIQQNKKKKIGKPVRVTHRRYDFRFAPLLCSIILSLFLNLLFLISDICLFSKKRSNVSREKWLQAPLDV